MHKIYVQRPELDEGDSLASHRSHGIVPLKDVSCMAPIAPIGQSRRRLHGLENEG